MIKKKKLLLFSSANYFLRQKSDSVRERKDKERQVDVSEERELDPANITSSIFREDLLCYSGSRACQ